MGIRRGVEVDAMLNGAERRGSCLYTTEKWALNVLRRRVHAGSVLEVDRCSFIRYGTWKNLDPLTRYLWRINAVATALPGCVFCRESAAVLYGLYVSYSKLQRVHVATTSKGHSSSSRLVTRHPVDGDEIVTIGGLRTTSLLRTSFDCMRTYEFPEALAIADSTLRFGAQRAALEAYVNGMRNYQGASMARWATAYADPRAENDGESIARAAMILCGFEIPDLQHPIKDTLTGKEYRADFYWVLPDGTKVVGELDGNRKYTDPAYMGGRTQTGVLLDERKRESRITTKVSRVCRFSPEEVRDQQYLTRLLDEYGIPRDPDNIPSFSKRFRCGKAS